MVAYESSIRSGSKSITKYRNYSDDEFISLVEAKLGKSPLVDELFHRLNVKIGEAYDIEDVEDKVQTLRQKIDNARSLLENGLEEGKEQDMVKCPICEADVCVTNVALVSPELRAQLEEHLELEVEE